METCSDPNRLIDALGGTAAVAALLGVSAPSVSAWRRQGIPDRRLVRLAPLLEVRGVVSRKVLFPSEWPTLWPEMVSGGSHPLRRPHEK